MIGTAFSSALSGLRAAAERINVSANNVANVQSASRFEDGMVVNEPYQPQDVQQSSQVNGGVLATVVPSQAEPMTVFDPNNPAADADGFVQLPNVSLDTEVVNQIRASAEYRANLDVLERESERLQSLVDLNE